MKDVQCNLIQLSISCIPLLATNMSQQIYFYMIVTRENDMEMTLLIGFVGAPLVGELLVSR